jgi:hypothetical protein
LKFTRVAYVLAWGMTIVAVLYGALAFSLASSDLTNEELTRYFPKGTGKAIDQSIELFFYGLVLGVLAEISRALHSSRRT